MAATTPEIKYTAYRVFVYSYYADFFLSNLKVCPAFEIDCCSLIGFMAEICCLFRFSPAHKQGNRISCFW